MKDEIFRLYGGIANPIRALSPYRVSTTST